MALVIRGEQYVPVIKAAGLGSVLVSVLLRVEFHHRSEQENDKILSANRFGLMLITAGG
jgi:hypothetical protein